MIIVILLMNICSLAGHHGLYQSRKRIVKPSVIT